MNGTSVSNGTRLSPISISQRRFGNFPESFGKWKTPLGCLPFTKTIRLEISGINIKQLSARLRERESL